MFIASLTVVLAYKTHGLIKRILLFRYYIVFLGVEGFGVFKLFNVEDV